MIHNKKEIKQMIEEQADDYLNNLDTSFGRFVPIFGIVDTAQWMNQEYRKELMVIVKEVIRSRDLVLVHYRNISDGNDCFALKGNYDKKKYKLVAK